MAGVGRVLRWDLVPSVLATLALGPPPSPASGQGAAFRVIPTKQTFGRTKAVLMQPRVPNIETDAWETWRHYAK